MTEESGKLVQFTPDIKVEAIRVYADDSWIEEAARISTLADQGGRPTGGLIRRLMRDRHGTPFEHGGTFTFRVEAPIFVFREWQRHRVGWSYNEQSGRYTEFQPIFYIPPGERPLVQTGKTMDYQFEAGDRRHRTITETMYRSACVDSWTAYVEMIEAGVAKEVARGVLPVTTFSSMYATCNPRSLMHFLGLRTKAPIGLAIFPSNPQWEINKAADKIEAVFKEVMPITWTAWDSNGRVAP